MHREFQNDELNAFLMLLCAAHAAGAQEVQERVWGFVEGSSKGPLGVLEGFRRGVETVLRQSRL